jgi:hypothetical protein
MLGVTMLRAVCLLVTVSALPAFAGLAQAKSDFDPDIDFTRYKTYSFLEAKELSKTGLLADPEVADRLKNFVSGAMEMRGLKEVPIDARHDLAVRLWVSRKIKDDVQTVAHPDPWMYWGGYPPYWGGAWGWYYEQVVVGQYAEGTLIIDLIDTTTKELAWRSYLRVDIKDRAKAYADAKKHLYKEFAGLPPSADSRERMRKKRAKYPAPKSA